ncbi:MAG: tetratricopeptide repeat protein, partial [Phaeodactylibacter sp.]|nr:tetratricopeptide repeat protein [Phaeodactylibacter sp.]
MTIKKIIDTAYRQIQDGETSEGITYLMNELKGKLRLEDYEGLTTISSNFSKLEKQNMLGLMSQEEYLAASARIVFGLLQLLDQIAEGPTPEAASQQNPSTNLSYAELSFTENAFFNAGANFLEEINAALEPPQNGTFILLGEAGVGKTFMAHKLAAQFIAQQRYAIIWYINSDQRENILHDFRSFAQARSITFSSEQELITNVKSYLSAQQSWLLIFDNALDERTKHENPQSFVNTYFPKLSPNSQILVTSRNNDWALFFPHIHLKTWSLADTGNFLESKNIQHTKKELAGLHALFEGLPLPLQQVASYIQRAGISLKRYLSIFEKNKVKMLTTVTPGGSYQNKNILNAIILSYDKLKEHLPIQAQRLVGLMAFFAPENIPNLLIAEKVEAHFEQTDTLAPAGNPYRDVLTCSESQMILLQFSLIKQTGDELCAIHRLTKEAILEHLKIKGWFEDFFRSAVNTIAISYTIENYFNLYSSNYLNLLTPHALNVLDLAEHMPISEDQMQQQLAELYFNVGFFLHTGGDEQKAQALLAKAKALGKGRNFELLQKQIELKPCHPARLHPKSETQTQAIQKLKDLLQYFHTEDSPNDVIVCLNRLGLTYTRNRDFEQAVDHLNQALAIQQYDFLYCNLGITYLEKGDLPQAEHYLKQAIQRAEPNNNIYIIGVARIILGTLKGLMGDRDQQVDNHEKALEIFDRIGEKRFITFALYPLLLFELE